MTLFRSLLFWLVLTSGTAYFWPANLVGFDPFWAPGPLLWTLVGVTMFSLGTLVRPSELAPLREHPWWVALGVAAQVLVMPLAAWTVVQLVEMPEDLAAGVILIGCVPGAMASNVLTHLAGGSVAFSVSLTAVATLLSPLTVPAILTLVVNKQPETTLTQSSIQLAMFVVLPTIVGYGMSRRLDSVRVLAGKFASLAASVALLWIIASVVAKSRSHLSEVGGELLVALLMINFVGYGAGWIVGRMAGLPENCLRALSLEVGMQNAGLGTTLAISLYGESTRAMIPTAAYTFGCMLTGTLLARVWHQIDARNAAKNAVQELPEF